MEKPFFEEALILARGYQPIREKLVEPIKPLTVDTSNSFNVLTLLSAQVCLTFFTLRWNKPFLFRFRFRSAVLNDRGRSIVMQRANRSMMSEWFFSSFSAAFHCDLHWFRWRVDKLEFKANNQPNRFLFYDRSLRRVPTPSEQALIDYKKELQEKIASGLPSASATTSTSTS